MHTVTTRPAESPAVGPLVVLADVEAHSSVVLAPARGAIVTSFRVGDRELLYLDASTLNDASKNVRGGVPILFPSPGKLENDTWSYGGKSGAMKQHGFARNMPWSLGTRRTDDAAAITLTLISTDATLAQFPWDFRLDFTFALRGASLRITQRIENKSATPLPYGIGFHPYFRCHDKASARIDTRATRAFDNVTKRIEPFSGFDLTRPEVDMHLLDHGSTSSALHFGDGSRIDLHASEELTRWVIWTIAGKDFVCLEPWSSPGNALNTGEGLLTLEPGSTHESWIEITSA